MAKVIDFDSKVFHTGEGRHFHVFDDCPGLWQGRNISMAHERTLWGELTDTYGDAIDQGKFACKRCHKRLGVAVPAEASLDVFRARNAEKRAARKAEKAAKIETVVEIAPVETTVELSASDYAALTELIADLEEMLKSFGMVAA